MEQPRSNFRTISYKTLHCYACGIALSIAAESCRHRRRTPYSQLPTMRSPNPPNSSHKTTPTLPPTMAAESWLDDACALDVDHFVKTLSSMKAKGVRPDLLVSIISHYASKWLTESTGSSRREGFVAAAAVAASPDGSVAAWMKKRFLVETLAAALPPERDAVQCGLALRLLRAASMVGAEAACLAELEARAASRLDQATLGDLMIPAFNHTCGTLLDVGLALRLVRRFVGLDEAVKSGSAMVKVAKLVDGYLAEAALDAGLTVGEFGELARALPAHARATDDGLYRAIDTFIKAHPTTTKEERKGLCRLIDTRKLSTEASMHAAQNERLPVRAVIQVLFSENSKLNRIIDWSGSFSGPRSPSLTALEPPGRCLSKREVLSQQQEIRRLRDDVMRLQIQCQSLQTQLERLAGADKKKKVFFRWSSLLFRSTDVVEKCESCENVIERRTPMEAKKARQEEGKATPKWRNSLG